MFESSSSWLVCHVHFIISPAAVSWKGCERAVWSLHIWCTYSNLLQSQVALPMRERFSSVLTCIVLLGEIWFREVDTNTDTICKRTRDIKTANSQEEKENVCFPLKGINPPGICIVSARTHIHTISATVLWLLAHRHTVNAYIEDKRVSHSLKVFSLTCGVPAMRWCEISRSFCTDDGPERERQRERERERETSTFIHLRVWPNDFCQDSLDSALSLVLLLLLLLLLLLDRPLLLSLQVIVTVFWPPGEAHHHLLKYFAYLEFGHNCLQSPQANRGVNSDKNCRA